MTQTGNEEIAHNFEILVTRARNGEPPDANIRSSLVVIIDWLAERVPYKTALPRGYSVLWTVKANSRGDAVRYHQLLKAATSAGPGVWIDTANLDSAEARDVRVFADDIAGGLIREISEFLKSNSEK